jgi:hypothetical protein
VTPRSFSSALTGSFPIPDEPKARGSLRIVDDARGLPNTLGDKPVFRDGMGIEKRGYSSRALFPKHQYAVELDGGDAALLGLPADDDWVLAAPYSDKSLMRNVLAHRTARALGRYAPRTRSSTRTASPEATSSS